MALKLSSVFNKMSSFRNPYSYDQFAVNVTEIKPAPGIKSIYFKADVTGETDTYKNYIQFFDVNFKPEEHAVHAEAKGKPEQKKEEPVKPADPFPCNVKVGGKDYFFAPIQAGENRVKFYCKCSDMMFTFSYPDWNKDTFIGAYKKYIRVPGSTRPPRNPDNIPGFCKHTMSHLRELQRKGYLLGI